MQGAETAWKTLAPLMEQCYLWVDFSCIDQDDNPAGELQALDRIVQVGGGAHAAECQWWNGDGVTGV